MLIMSLVDLNALIFAEHSELNYQWIDALSASAAPIFIAGPCQGCMPEWIIQFVSINTPGYVTSDASVSMLRPRTG